MAVPFLVVRLVAEDRCQTWLQSTAIYKLSLCLVWIVELMMEQ